MGRGLKNISASKSEYTRHYSGFHGVILGADPSEIPTDRLSDCVNMYRDYDSEGGAIESVPGFRRIASLGGEIRAIHRQRLDGGDRILIHSGSSIYSLSEDGLYSDTSPTLVCNVGNNPTRGFSFGECYYLLGGERMLVIDKEGVSHTVGDGGIEPYVPTTHISGTPHQQRNLLTDKFFEEYNISDPTPHIHGTHGLHYEITDAALTLCAVVGCDEGVSGAVYVPSYTFFGSTPYKVTEIADKAFSENTNITEVHIAEGVKRIGKLAFYGASSLKTAITPETIEMIDAGAFGNCSALCNLHLGKGLCAFGLNVFSFCFALESVTFGSSQEDFEKIENKNVIGNATVTYDISHDEMRIELPLHGSVTEIFSLTLNGEQRPFTPLTEGGFVISVLYDAPGSWDVGGGKFRVGGRLAPLSSNFGTDTEDNEAIGSDEAIHGCRICEIFDGRIFLSANERVPGAVFYTERDDTGKVNPLYFGESDYFTDGMGRTPIRSMLAVRDRLAIFKDDDDGCGSILYHVPRETSDDLVPKIYPVEYVHSGLGACGSSISFLDDPVFVSQVGICALSSQAINYTRSVVCRSHNVNYDLLTKDLSAISLGLWQGYLAVLSEGDIYLADSRSTFRHKTGGTEYDWFVLRGIGTYRGGSRVYRYCSFGFGDYSQHPDTDGVCRGVVYSTVTENGDTVYYSNENGSLYHVYPTEEFEGGEFSPATVLLGTGKRLIFGTPSGDVCVFNNDMRGVAPPYIADADGFDPEEYISQMGRRIHPFYYSFCDRSPLYKLTLPLDDCSIPHLTKSTVKRSAVIKLKGSQGAGLTVEVGTDRTGYKTLASYPSCAPDFTELDFGRLGFDASEHYTLPVDEKERGWIEKQYTVWKRGFRSPLGLYSLSYRYSVKGRIKKS